MSDKLSVRYLAGQGEKDHKRVERGVRAGTVYGTLSRQEIYEADSALWLAVQEETLAKVWDNDEDAEYDDSFN